MIYEDFGLISTYDLTRSRLNGVLSNVDLEVLIKDKTVPAIKKHKEHKQSKATSNLVSTSSSSNY